MFKMTASLFHRVLLLTLSPLNISMYMLFLVHFILTVWVRPLKEDSSHNIAEPVIQSPPPSCYGRYYNAQYDMQHLDPEIINATQVLLSISQSMSLTIFTRAVSVLWHFLWCFIYYNPLLAYRVQTFIISVFIQLVHYHPFNYCPWISQIRKLATNS